MNANRQADKKMLLDMNQEELVDLLFLQLRNMWSVDGLYFLGIEEKFETQDATQIDRNVWEIMGSIEAKRLKKLMGSTKTDIPTMIKALRISSWALDLEDKEIEVHDDKAVFRNPNCRVQKTRIKKALGEFPCKYVRWGYLKNFAKEFNESIIVECRSCPPDPHPENMWCEWEFRLKMHK